MKNIIRIKKDCYLHCWEGHKDFQHRCNCCCLCGKTQQGTFGDWEKEYDDRVNALARCTHWGKNEEGPIFEFGGRLQRDNELFTVPDWGHIKKFIRKVDHAARLEERQFILNILDGIDIADKESGNIGGGTKAIRHALKSRII